MAAKEIFEEQFLGPLGEGVPWVWLRGGFRINTQATYLLSLTAMNKQEACSDTLIEATAAALNEDALTLMLVAVQKKNLGLSVNFALKRPVLQFKRTEWKSHQVIQGQFQWWV